MRSLTRLVVLTQKFVINVDGSVSFVTAPDFAGSAAGTNSYSFSTASDGTLSDVQAVTVNVGDVAENVAPVIPPTPTGGVVLDFEGYASNGDGHTTSRQMPSSVTVDGWFGYGVETIKEIDGTTDRTMLVVEKAADSWWWGLYSWCPTRGTDMIGDGTSAITMRVYAQDGNLNLE